MNEIFENVTCVDKKLYINAYKEYYSKNLESSLICGIVFLTMSICLLILSNWVAALAMAPMAYLSFLNFYKLKGSFEKNYIWNQKRSTPEGISYKFFEEKIQFSSANSWTKYEYSDVEKVLETRAAVIIGFNDRFIIIDKQRFKKGDPEGFKAFIENKRKGQSGL